MARQALELGIYISISGIVTFKNPLELQEIVKFIPLEFLLVETDSPYLAPMPHRGKPNVPAYVRHTAEFAAQHVFRISVDELAAISSANAKRFFGLR